MTLIKPNAGKNADDCVTAAEELFEEAIQAVVETKNKLEREELDALTDVKAVAQNVTQATKLLLQEVGRVHELHKRKSGIVHDYAIDFDAARLEIRRRLACLRSVESGR